MFGSPSSLHSVLYSVMYSLMYSVLYRFRYESPYVRELRNQGVWIVFRLNPICRERIIRSGIIDARSRAGNTFGIKTTSEPSNMSFTSRGGSDTVSAGEIRRHKLQNRIFSSDRKELRRINNCSNIRRRKRRLETVCVSQNKGLYFKQNLYVYNYTNRLHLIDALPWRQDRP